MVRCPECGGARAYPDAWPGHLATCSVGLFHYRRYQAEKDLRAVVGALIDERRDDVDWLVRLRRRIEVEPTIFDHLAFGRGPYADYLDRAAYSFATLPLGLTSTREMAAELLTRLAPHLEHPELPVREMVQSTYGALSELRVMGDPRVLDYRPVDDSDHGPGCDGPGNCVCSVPAGLIGCDVEGCAARFFLVADREFPTLCLEHSDDASREAHGWTPENSF